MGEQLLCEREPGNVVDRYAMAVLKEGFGCHRWPSSSEDLKCAVCSLNVHSTQISRDQQITAFTKTMRILILRIVPNAILKSSRKKPTIRYNVSMDLFIYSEISEMLLGFHKYQVIHVV